MEPKKPEITVDPNLAPQQAQAQAALISGLQNQAMSDTANLMARYGTRLALSSGSGTSAPVGVA